MARTFRQPGEVLTWENDTGGDVSAGDVVVLGSVAGVALVDIADGEEGSVGIAGVHELPKATGQAWDVGDVLNWDASEGEFTTSGVGSGDVDAAGKAVADAASADEEGLVLLTPQAAVAGSA